MKNEIEKFRTYYGLSRRELAKMAEISPSGMNYIESGERIPNVIVAIRLARILKTTVEILFGGE